MDYSFLAQDATVTVSPQSGFRSFFRPMTRLFPTFFRSEPQRSFQTCVPVPLPEGVLGRDANGNLTVNGQTYCSPRATNDPYGTYGRPAYYP